MIRKFLVIWFLAFIWTELYAQEYSMKFGVVSDEEYDLEEFEFDKDAVAVVIYDVGKSRFVRVESGYDEVYKRSTRIKILTDAGIIGQRLKYPIIRKEKMLKRYQKLRLIHTILKMGK